MKCHPAWRQGGTLLWSWWSLQFRHSSVFLYCLKYPLFCHLRRFCGVALVVVVADCAITNAINAPLFLHQIPINTLYSFFILFDIGASLIYNVVQVYRQVIHLYIFINFFLKKFLLMYSWFTMLCPSLLYSRVTQLYTYFYIFLNILFCYDLSGRLDIVPVLCRRTLLFVHSKCSSLHLLLLLLSRVSRVLLCATP